jgi:large conductance mechanosensitive channel
MIKEFKNFVLRGNVFDMAVGIIIGAAFGKIVSSFVSDVITPPLGMILGKVDFSNLFVSLSGEHYASLADAKKAGAATLNYGVFLNATLDFLIVAFCLFVMIQFLERLKKREIPSATSQNCPYCLNSIPAKAKKCGHCTSEL